MRRSYYSGEKSGAVPPFGRVRILDLYFTRASRMNGKKIFGILAGLMLVFVLTWPLAAAEQTFELNIPGCTA